SSRRRHTRFSRDWSSDVCSSDLDGPTHQPVEHLSALRCIPNLLVLRPADAQETAEAWRTALKHRTGPSALVLTRQKLPLIDRNRSEERRVGKEGRAAWAPGGCKN